MKKKNSVFLEKKKGKVRTEIIKQSNIEMRSKMPF